jgi:thiamine biosynthesis lipoprotein
MGSRWSAIVHVAPYHDLAGLAADLQAAVDRVDDQMSTWKPNSDLNRINAAPVGRWLDAPAELMAVLDAALAIGQASGGAFDIGVGDLVRVFGFGGGRRRPDAAGIAATAGRPSFEPPKTLELDRLGRRLRKHAALSLDLSGIAKGYGVDELARVVEAHGIGSYLVGIDGEMRAGCAKPDGRPWMIGHERPDPDARDLAGLFELTAGAVATSGNYRHTAVVGDRRVSHTMDPRSGMPVDNDLASATVFAPTCMAADAWATAFMVLGADAALALARRCGPPAVLVRRDGATLSSLDRATGLG